MVDALTKAFLEVDGILYETDTINDIADELNISSKTLSKIIDILEQELELIVTDRAYRVKNENDEFRTLPTIFANAYKREDKYLLYAGDNYSRNEIELKAENMRKHYQGYRIDKKKRKKGRSLSCYHFRLIFMLNIIKKILLRNG